MATGRTVNAITDWPQPVGGEPSAADALFSDEDFIERPAVGDPYKALVVAAARQRTLQLLGVEMRSVAQPAYNPAPGRQVITPEGSHKYQLPIGSTILPNGKIRLPNGQVVTKATAKKYYIAGGGTPAKAASTAKYTPDLPSKKSAPKVAKPPAKKATKASKQAAGLKSDGVLTPPEHGAHFSILSADQRGASGDGYAPGGQWGIYGAAGVLLRDTSGPEPRYLLVQRGPMTGHNTGLWQLPGGARDQHEDAYQGAARELHEEVGASEFYVTGITPVGEHVYTHTPTGWTYTTLAANVDKGFTPQVDGTETGDAKWVTAAEIEQMRAAGQLTPNTEKSLQSIIDSMPVVAPKGPDLSTNVPDVTLVGGSWPGKVPADAPDVYYNGQRIGRVVANPDGTWTSMDGLTALAVFSNRDAAITHLIDWHAHKQKVTPGGIATGGPTTPSIHVDHGTLPKGAKKVAPTVQAAAPTTETVFELKILVFKGSYTKAAWKIYVGTTEYGTVEQSQYGGWGAYDPAGKGLGLYFTSKAKAVAALVDHKDKADAIAAQQAKADAAAAAKAAKAAAQAARVAEDLGYLRGRSPNPTPDEARVYAGDFSHLTRVGPQGGSNPGGIFQAPDGSKWYVKTQKSAEHAANEALAVDLYRAAGIDAPEVYVGSGAPDLPAGAQTATRILDTIKSDLADKVKGAAQGRATDSAFVRRAHQGFAVDTWLANWDVAGTNNDNLVNLDDQPVRIDSGGSLLYRAQGESKGAQFGPVVTEWDRWLDPSKAGQATPAGHAAALFSTANHDEIIASVARVEQISPDRIRQMVAARGLPASLADTLILRREDILRRAGDIPTAPAAPFGHGALTGDAAGSALRIQTLTGIVKVLTGDGVSQKDAQAAKSSVTGYTSNGHTIVNPYLYGYGSPTATYGGETAAEIAANIDLVMDHAGLSQDVIVHWGMRDLGRRFPPGTYDLAGSDAAGNGATGMEFDARGFASTSTSESQAQSFTGYSWSSSKPKTATAQRTVVRIQLPKGTGVIRGMVSEDELILDRRLRFRIVADYGVDKYGMRRLDAVVIGHTQTRHLGDLSDSEMVSLLAAHGLPTDGTRSQLLERLHAAGIKVQ